MAATTSKQRRRAFLESVELFAGLSPPVLDGLAELSANRSLEPNQVLCHRGDEAGQLYGVLQGRLKAVGSSVDGREVVFVVLGPGEVTGEIALIDGKARSATLVAIDRCELLVLGRREFLALLREDSEAAIQLCQVLAAYVRRLSDTVEDAYYHKLPVRLAKKLLVLGREHGEETPDGLRIGVKLSQREIGELVGKTREAVNKQLRSWTDAELLGMADGHLVIRDVDRLEDIADGF
ncbi:MAG: Crp/Fnr family transcriptional regulator [Myxococcota bacterium]|nr:Crp/Fnr family transcriptional regulator [Myxococcota bacterium]